MTRRRAASQMVDLAGRLAPDQKSSDKTRAQCRDERFTRILPDVFFAVFAQRAGALASFIVGDAGLRLHFFGGGTAFGFDVFDGGAHFGARVVGNIRRPAFDLLHATSAIRFQLIEHPIEIVFRKAQFFAESRQKFITLAFGESEVVIGELAVALLEVAFDRVSGVFQRGVFHSNSDFARCGAAGRVAPSFQRAVLQHSTMRVFRARSGHYSAH